MIFCFLNEKIIYEKNNFNAIGKHDFIQFIGLWGK